MFSGIVEGLGQVKNISKQGRVTIFQIKANRAQEDCDIGDSICVDGVCLTVIKKEKDVLSLEVIPETLKITTLGRLRVADKVNLERSLKITDRLSGHFVTGHIDCMGTIHKRNYINGNLCFQIACPLEYMNFISPKGSIAVDGISLTVADKRSNTFTVYIIPHTLKNTTFNFKRPSSNVNIELDILAKYSRK